MTLTNCVISAVSSVLAYGNAALCVAVFPELSVTLVPAIICPTTVSSLDSAPIEYLASARLVMTPAGPAFVLRSSSPITQVCSGTMIGSISLYCPVEMLIRLLGLLRAGTLANAAAICGAVTAAARAVIASVITSTNPAAVV